MNDARCTRRGRPRPAWMDNIKTWTGLPVEESIRMTEDRDKWRKYVHGVANPRIKDNERDNARNNARCMQARKTTHGLDGQHQDIDRTPRVRVQYVIQTP